MRAGAQCDELESPGMPTRDLQRVDARIGAAMSAALSAMNATQEALDDRVTAIETAGVDPTFQSVVKGADQTDIGTTFADVTGLSLAVLANKTYSFRFELICDADAVTTGIDVAVAGPTSPVSIVYTQRYWTSATVETMRGGTTYDSNTASTASNGNSPRIFVVEGVLVNGANAGNLVARAKREAVGAGPHVRRGSCGLAWQLD